MYEKKQSVKPHEIYTSSTYFDMPFSIFALFYLLPRLYNKDSWSLFCETFSLLEGCFDPSWRITLETKANKKLSHFRADRGAITLEQKIRSSRPTQDPKSLKLNLIFYTMLILWRIFRDSKNSQMCPYLVFHSTADTKLSRLQNKQDRKYFPSLKVTGSVNVSAI